MSRPDWRLDPEFRNGPKHAKDWDHANVQHGDGDLKAVTLIVLSLILAGMVLGGLKLLGVIW